MKFKNCEIGMKVELKEDLMVEPLVVYKKGTVGVITKIECLYENRIIIRLLNEGYHIAIPHRSVKIHKHKPKPGDLYKSRIGRLILLMQIDDLETDNLQYNISEEDSDGGFCEGWISQDDMNELDFICNIKEKHND